MSRFAGLQSLIDSGASLSAEQLVREILEWGLLAEVVMPAVTKNERVLVVQTLTAGEVTLPANLIVSVMHAWDRADRDRGESTPRELPAGADGIVKAP